MVSIILAPAQLLCAVTELIGRCRPGISGYNFGGARKWYLGLVKITDWKSIAELVGIAAIVASLVFVGIQLRQDRQFAQAEAMADMLENGLESRASINQFAYVLAKGNSGAELDQGDSIIIRNIVRNEQDRVLLHGLRERAIGGSTVDTPELWFAVFLYQNPAAREAWEQIAADMELLVDPLRSPESLQRTRQSGSAAFRERIRKHLAKLDEVDS